MNPFDPLGLFSAEPEYQINCILADAKSRFKAEGWTDEQVSAAVEYALRWAEGNASQGDGGDPNLHQTLTQNYLIRGIELAATWLHRSREKWRNST